MITHCTDWPNELVGLEVVWPHHCELLPAGQRLLTFKTMVLNGPVKPAEYGSAVAVTLKQRPHASPGPRPGSEPKASWLIPAVKPVVVLQHAAGILYSACALLWSATRGAHRESGSPGKT